MVHWYKHDPDAFIAGTIGLTLEEVGAYSLMIDMAYARDGDLPDDVPYLATLCRCHWRTIKAIRQSLIDKGKIRSEGGKIVPRRVQECLKEVSEFSQEQSKRASKGWQKRKNPNDNNKSKMPMAAVPPGKANTTTTRIEEPKDVSSISGELCLGFESERSPDDGELASAMGDARRSPPSVDPPLNEPEGKKRLSEEERAAQIGRLGIRLKRFPDDRYPVVPTPAADLVAEEPPITASAALLQTPLVQKTNGHGNSGAPFSRTEIGKPEGWDLGPPRKKLSKMSLDELMAEPDDSQEKVA